MGKLLGRYWELVSYGFWGVMTTLVNYGVYFFCTRGVGLGPVAGNGIAWMVSVAFAFVVNKQFVFLDWNWRRADVVRELWQFGSARLLSGGMETLLLFIFVRWLGVDDGTVKIFAGILVVLMNYIISKRVIFAET